jgi:hypothetical protein
VVGHGRRSSFVSSVNTRRCSSSSEATAGLAGADHENPLQSVVELEAVGDADPAGGGGGGSAAPGEAGGGGGDDDDEWSSVPPTVRSPDGDAPNATEVLALQSAKRAFGEAYRRAAELETFGLLNHTAAVVLLLRHDELLLLAGADPPAQAPPTAKALLKGGRARGASGSGRDAPGGVVAALSTAPVLALLRRHVPFGEALELKQLQRRHEDLYAKVFCGGSADIARAELVPPPPLSLSLSTCLWVSNKCS